MKCIENRSYETYHINALNVENAIEIAKDVAQQKGKFSTKTLYPFESDDKSTHPQNVLESNIPEEEENVINKPRGYQIEITRLGYSVVGQDGSEYDSDYIATQIELKNKPYFMPDGEEFGLPALHQVICSIDKNEKGELFFNKEDIAQEIQQKYQCDHLSREQIKNLINNQLKHNLTNKNSGDKYLVIFILEPPAQQFEDEFDQYQALLALNKNTNDVIINTSLANQHKLFDSMAQEAIQEITLELLEEKISNKSKKKNITKI